MATSPPDHLNLPPPAFPQGPPASPSPPAHSKLDPRRKSFGHRSFNRPASRAKYMAPDEEFGDEFIYETKPAIPTALPKQDENPLPVLPMLVLSIAMLGEFLSANVSTPFLLFMVEGFGIEKSQVGSYTGVLVSMFFVTQFLTSVLWATVADKHGRRAVLFISLLGSSLTCLFFGTARTFSEAVAIRLMQGIFGGSIGVARGAVAVITDPSNEARAYAVVGFAWGLGAVIGGAFETPANRWPDSIGSIPLFVNYPYILPCGIAASVTFTGAILSLFLGWDGGPREGLIRLPVEKDGQETLPTVAEMQESPNQLTPAEGRSIAEERPETVVDRVAEQAKHVQKKISGYFARRVREAYASPRHTPLITDTQALPIPGSGRLKPRTLSQVTGPGSAYGYSGARSRLGSTVTGGAGRSPGAALRNRRLTGQSLYRDDEGGTEELTFAQRLLLANEQNVTNMASLWVAAAINADNEDPFYDESEFDLTPAMDTPEVEERADQNSVFLPEEEDSRPVTPAGHRVGPRPSSSRPSFGSSAPGGRFRPSFGFGPLTQLNAPSPRPSHREVPGTTPHQTPRFPPGSFGTPRLGFRRGSSTSNLGLPAIYNNTGLSSPPALAQDVVSLFTDDDRGNLPGHGGGLSVISEGSGSVTGLASTAPSVHPSEAAHIMPDPIKEPSLWRQLPLVMIVQYGVLALHNTVHDQYFLTYLVSPYTVGGLGLNAAHFAQLIALMCLAQIFYQFYLYPNIGPPRGPMSHLAMFRIGSALFIPSYLSVILYRAFASETEDGNFIVMALLTLSTAVRFCGITFSYTSISILINYMSPPHLVSLSNSIGQSTVALARFVGPILGGYLWSACIQDGPAGYPWGFYLVSAACGIAILHSFTIR
ncbi:hypothetical protein FRB90_011440 [Tulasnella sp. 427]|nr:hypothetical protein FRB90_011440 [Tulasnella sp. 427]